MYEIKEMSNHDKPPFFHSLPKTTVDMKREIMFVLAGEFWLPVYLMHSARISKLWLLSVKHDVCLSQPSHSKILCIYNCLSLHRNPSKDKEILHIWVGAFKKGGDAFWLTCTDDQKAWPWAVFWTESVNVVNPAFAHVAAPCDFHIIKLTGP